MKWVFFIAKKVEKKCSENKIFSDVSNLSAKKVEKKCSENKTFWDVIFNPKWYKKGRFSTLIIWNFFNPKIWTFFYPEVLLHKLTAFFQNLRKNHGGFRKKNDKKTPKWFSIFWQAHIKTVKSQVNLGGRSILYALHWDPMIVWTESPLYVVLYTILYIMYHIIYALSLFILISFQKMLQFTNKEL